MSIVNIGRAWQALQRTVGFDAKTGSKLITIEADKALNVKGVIS